LSTFAKDENLLNYFFKYCYKFINL